MKKKNSKKTMSDYILLGVFILLIIIVLVLLIKVIKHKPVETTTNFKIPIIENKFSTKLSVDLKKLQDSKGAYILEIPIEGQTKQEKYEITFNYINDKLSSIEIHYYPTEYPN